jgi:hypothetical protein
MFNILLMVAGLLVYILLGVQFKVRHHPIYQASLTLPLWTGKLPKHLPRRHPHRRRIRQRGYRLLPDPEIRGHPRFVPGDDTTGLSSSQRW